MQPLSTKKGNDEIFIKLVSFAIDDILIPKFCCSFANVRMNIIFVSLGF
uniref:Uncharacterized protein n=1 Tax=Arundo donax TaxID=35708 RepID=A0A0A9CYM7_ARUDO